MNQREIDLAEEYCSRASIKMREGDFQSAIGDYTAALDIQQDGWTHFLRGKAFLLIHHNDDALSDYLRAKELGIPIHHDLIDICTRSAREDVQ